MEPAAAAHRHQSFRSNGLRAAAGIAVVATLLVAVGVIPLPDTDAILEDAWSLGLPRGRGIRLPRDGRLHRAARPG
jgi:hypothetical protein